MYFKCYFLNSMAVIPSYRIVTKNEYKNINEEAAQQYLNNSNIPILVVEQKSLHFVPLLKSNLDNKHEQQIGREETQSMSNSYTFSKQ